MGGEGWRAPAIQGKALTLLYSHSSERGAPTYAAALNSFKYSVPIAHTQFTRVTLLNHTGTWSSVRRLWYKDVKAHSITATRVKEPARKNVRTYASRGLRLPAQRPRSGEGAIV